MRPSTLLSLATALLLAALAPAPASALGVPRIAQEERAKARALIDEARGSKDPGPTLRDALGRLFTARDLVEAALARDEKPTAELEEEIRNINVLIYWCRRNTPLSGGEGGPSGASSGAGREEPPEPKSEAETAEERAKELFLEAERFAAEHPEDPFLVFARYFEVAKRHIGTEWSIKAQERSLEIQSKLVAGGGKGASEKGGEGAGGEKGAGAGAGTGTSTSEKGTGAAEAGKATKGAAAIAEGLAKLLHCKALALKDGRVELFFDFEDPAQHAAWPVLTATWRVSGGMLSGERGGASGPAWTWLDVPLTGNVSLEFKATLVGHADSIDCIVHAVGDKQGYGIGIGWEGGRKGGGFHALGSIKPKAMQVEVGKTYSIKHELEGKKVVYKVNGNPIFGFQDPAPLTMGRVGFGTWGRVVYDDVRVRGTPDPKWLEEKGLAGGRGK